MGDCMEKNNKNKIIIICLGVLALFVFVAKVNSPSVDKDYSDVYELGFKNGYESGNDRGYVEGQESAKKEGYSKGYDDGLAGTEKEEIAQYSEENMPSGTWNGEAFESYDIAYDEGYDYGYEEGKRIGYDKGYAEEYTSAYNRGYDDGVLAKNEEETKSKARRNPDASYTSEIGIWNGDTFESELLNMSFEIPDGIYVYTDEEYEAGMVDTDEILEDLKNENEWIAKALDSMETKNGFMAKNSDKTISMFVACDIILEDDMSLDEYMGIQEFIINKAYPNISTTNKIETREIAGKIFTLYRTDIYSGTAYIDNYISKEENMMIYIGISYLEQGPNPYPEVLDGITKLK